VSVAALGKRWKALAWYDCQFLSHVWASGSKVGNLATVYRALQKGGGDEKAIA